mmetsp:Transcript_17688/g.38587  ORF Transcript_17688/g.38587 Transcript_17688/m.38587 type:complete len:295 (-) Transcript_17688:270-1154(-)|eukprot:CAMPEP_0118932840 /NCGR_PEP_ID=MMETSP1169-20130426/10647_1 /TAXON_ID=36882 /ORGANISM="Pyramimonas obovata, Strain CCMP722" /LENGTH=294 /DNA_ID=CAMNT_0006875541 /DNA_START=185 /DNA_END=1069 /DNA_ORIENTATION=-
MSSTRRGFTLLVALALVAVASADFTDYYDANDDYDYSMDWKEGDCVTGDDGVSRVNGTVCELEIAGEDTIPESLYAGGITGRYKYTGECQNGRPGYKRDDKPGQKSGMWLFYSRYWGDWDFCNKTTLADECVTGYGGEGYGEARPQDILDGDWFVLKFLQNDLSSEDDFVSTPKLTVKCVTEHADGAGTCTDGVMNGEEEGVDCGGPCNPCVNYGEQQMAIKALEAKLRNEWEQEQRETRLSGSAKAAILIIALVGCAIVCGGPLIFCLKAMKTGKGYVKIPIPVPSANIPHTL